MQDYDWNVFAGMPRRATRLQALSRSLLLKLFVIVAEVVFDSCLELDFLILGRFNARAAGFLAHDLFLHVD